MIRNRIALLAVALLAGLFTSTLAVAAAPAGHGVSVESVQDEMDFGSNKPPNCGTPDTPKCEA